MEKICVAVRVRPVAGQATSNGAYWKVEDNRISLHKRHGTPISGVSYAFDHIFDPSHRNATVYELLTKDIIQAAVEGFNGTAFAYGQTSSGKTFTMNGTGTDPGIIHRAIKDIFTMIQSKTDREYLIRVSYMEIYNEEIIDLLAVENQKLQIHESLERGIYVAGLKEEIVNSADQVLKLLESGEDNRHFGETNMNARSSRSHTIFRMVIESKGKDSNSSTDYSSVDAIRVSVLNLVDLAGSERIAKTGVGGVRLKEGKHINKSLMALGNVINKLSDGLKQRGHIPYRDSKLTRILQPALGGNAKTTIICTITPEEDHIEETKGTLHFASRAKRITNCAQVNEILTDAALLKRQKLEIEELRKKLQGFRAEVLEQEILKLRNDMLKYEFEREKLAVELEEERRSQRERDQCIREQQMKIDSLSNLVTVSDCDKTFSQGQGLGRQDLKEESNDSHSICQGEEFRTPSFKQDPHAFVVRRTHYSRLPDCSPLPDSFSNVADEDAWLRMNNGYVADLDLLEATPSRKVQSFPSSEATTGRENDENKHDAHGLRRQLQLATKENDELKNNHKEQLLINKQLMEEISKLRHETLSIRELPKMLCESISNFKDTYRDVMSIMQSLKFANMEAISEANEDGINLLSTLETYFLEAMDGRRTFVGKSAPIQEQWKALRERLNRATPSLLPSESDNGHLKNDLCSCSDEGGCTSREEECREEANLKSISEKCQRLQEELNASKKLLDASDERYRRLENEFLLLKDERDSLLQKASDSNEKLTLVVEQKEKFMKELEAAAQRRRDLEDGIKLFSVAFSRRQRSLASFHGEFKSKIEKLKGQESGFCTS